MRRLTLRTDLVMTDLYYGNKQMIESERVVYKFPQHYCQTADSQREQEARQRSFITIYLCSTLNWVDISLVQSGEIPPLRVLVRDDSAVCR